MESTGEDAQSDRYEHCSQCGKPALVSVPGHGLCVEHFHLLSVAQTLQLQNEAVMMNFTLAEMEEIVGYRSSHRMQIPQIPNGSINNTKINVSGGTIGSINSGTVKSIMVSVGAFREAGHHEIEKALYKLTEAVVKSHDLANRQKNEILEKIEYLSQQIAANPPDRKAGMIKSVLEDLSKSIGVVADVSGVWDLVSPVIRSTFGL